jgi:hypothetical protein
VKADYQCRILAECPIPDQEGGEAAERVKHAMYRARAMVLL